MRKSIEMKNKFETLKSEAQELLDAGKIAEAKAKMEEVKEQKAAIEMQETLEREEDAALKNKSKETAPLKEHDSAKAFANAARHGFQNSMSEGTAEDGGYTVPEDIQTKINTYKTSKASLLDHVTVEKVKTSKGARTFKKRSQQTGFSKVGEGGKIGAKSTPQFERLSYEIEKYAGYLPVTSELLNDTDANIVGILTEWIGDESRITANKLILEQLKSVGETPLAGIDDIKKALNVTLGSAFKATSKIFTNDDGLQYLDTLKDTDGRYLLSANPSEPLKLQLSAGATVITVVAIPNGDLPTEGNKIPFIIGDLHEGIVYWDREHTSIINSSTAQIGDLNAFEEDLRIYRAIEREDVTTKDTEAFVYGVIEVTPVVQAAARSRAKAPAKIEPGPEETPTDQQ